MINFGKSLKEQREKAGISQSQLALEIGVKQQNLSRWESNSNVPNVVDCIKLADYFNISFDELVGRVNYATGNIEIIGEKLSDKEQKLIDCYRSLTEDGKSAFVSMAENIATMYKRASKLG